MTDMQYNAEALQIYNSLASTLFPTSSYILAQTAVANYNLRGIYLLLALTIAGAS
jgi:hypothetical protein